MPSRPGAAAAENAAALLVWNALALAGVGVALLAAVAAVVAIVALVDAHIGARVARQPSDDSRLAVADLLLLAAVAATTDPEYSGFSVPLHLFLYMAVL